MRCPKCGSRDDKVIDSRQSRDSSSIRRRRECLKCKYRFTTYEEIERSDLRVVKRDRTHEPFDRRKLATSIAKAFEKRSASLLTLEEMVDEIVHELETSGREVPSSAIGAKVLEKLRRIDEVAYLRYASVHQRFEDVDQFVDAIHTLGRRIKPNALQRELFPPAPPPISISLFEIAEQAGTGYELAFFDLLERRINALIQTGMDNLQLCSLQPCVKHLRGVKVWTRACDALREEIVCFVREKIASITGVKCLDCSVR